MIAQDGERALGGHAPREDRRHRPMSVCVHGGRVAEPGGLPRKPGEGRKAYAVHLLGFVHERHGWELVEDDEDDGRGRLDRDGGRVLRLHWEHEARHRGCEQEEPGEHERRGTQHREERAGGRDLQVDEGGEPAQGRRGQQEPRPGAGEEVIAHVEAAHCHERGDKRRWRTGRRPGRTIPASTSIARSTAGGTSVTPSAKRMMSPGGEPRTAKNSGLREKRSKRGWATARDQRAPSWPPARRIPRTDCCSSALVGATLIGPSNAYHTLRRRSAISAGEAGRGFAFAPARPEAASATSGSSGSGTPRSRRRSKPARRASSSTFPSAPPAAPTDSPNRAISAAAAGSLKRRAGGRQTAFSAPCEIP